MGYWVTRTYISGKVGEKTKYYITGERTRSSRKIKSTIKKQEQNDASAEKQLARLLNINFKAGVCILRQRVLCRLREKILFGQVLSLGKYSQKENCARQGERVTCGGCKAFERGKPLLRSVCGKIRSVKQAQLYIVETSKSKCPPWHFGGLG